VAENVKLLEVLEAVERLSAPQHADVLAAAISSGLVSAGELDEAQQRYYLSENGTMYLQSLRRERARQTCVGIIASSGGNENTTREQVRTLAEVVLGLLESIAGSDPDASAKNARIAEIAMRLAQQGAIAS
jgi:hypothetical protein